MIKTVFIVGPTGVGKTKYAIEYAKKNNGEIVSADSMQIYKYMNIGSAKPSKEEMNGIKHYLIDEIDPRDSFSVFEYQTLALQYINEIYAKGKLPIVCGGTGLYVNSLVYDMDFSAPKGDQQYRNQILSEEDNDPIKLHERLRKLDPNAALEIHPNNIKRVLRAIERIEKGEDKINSFSKLQIKNKYIEPEIIYLNMDREKLYQRLNERVEQMYRDGLEEEVRGLMEQGFKSEDVAMKGIGYKEIIDCIYAGKSPEDAKELIKLNTRHYAKRQITWFNRYKQARIIML